MLLLVIDSFSAALLDTASIKLLRKSLRDFKAVCLASSVLKISSAKEGGSEEEVDLLDKADLGRLLFSWDNKVCEKAGVKLEMGWDCTVVLEIEGVGPGLTSRGISGSIATSSRERSSKPSGTLVTEAKVDLIWFSIRAIWSSVLEAE